MNKQYVQLAMLGVALVACGTDDLATDELGQASSVHLKGGANAEPVFTDLGLALRAAGALSGLGNGDIQVTLTANGTASATCTNPAGAQQPPGQNPATVTLEGTQGIPQDQIKNGTVAFNVMTGVPVTPVPGAPGCPNPRWRLDITDVSFTSAIIDVEQPVGTLVLSLACTFSAPTTNGGVPSGNVTCI
jgi:hypothetical protein